MAPVLTMSKRRYWAYASYKLGIFVDPIDLDSGETAGGEEQVLEVGCPALVHNPGIGVLAKDGALAPSGGANAFDGTRTQAH